ncbi:unnamed protein product [Amoebophrya sp. A25]|nr:unnamed protein product [Amoebophrya sp. A25]|eukprot:GSA25T00004367001.1
MRCLLVISTLVPPDGVTAMSMLGRLQGQSRHSKQDPLALGSSEIVLSAFAGADNPGLGVEYPPSLSSNYQGATTPTTITSPSASPKTLMGASTSSGKQLDLLDSTSEIGLSGGQDAQNDGHGHHQVSLIERLESLLSGAPINVTHSPGLGSNMFMSVPLLVASVVLVLMIVGIMFYNSMYVF